jgi:hypothetical protein
MPGSFANAEATKALEKNHGFYLSGYLNEAIEAGAVYARRALVLISMSENWGPPLKKGRELQPGRCRRWIYRWQDSMFTPKSRQRTKKILREWANT